MQKKISEVPPSFVTAYSLSTRDPIRPHALCWHQHRADLNYGQNYWCSYN